MTDFLSLWETSATTTLGLFWMAFWAFGLGYVISGMIQVFVTKEKMQKLMGKAGPRSVALGTFFGFISSSCSFAALATTRAIFVKGASLIPSLAFLLASTNLVIELGIVISIFLGWQFVAGEYIGGLLLIALMALTVKLTLPEDLAKRARDKAKSQEGGGEEESVPDWKKLIKSKEGWVNVGKRYVMEWKMVWKDVSIGFTVAGIIAAFVPQRFFETLFIGAGSADNSFLEILAQSLVGPLAAFFTFIGSMGNIPLAAVLFSHGVSFAGIMAFIFSDLVVFPVLRIQSKYYGWKMAFYILAVFLIILIASALIIHYGFAAFGFLPDPNSAKSVVEREFFKIDYSFYLNVLFLAVSALALGVFFKEKRRQKEEGEHHHHHHEQGKSEKVLFWLSMLAYAWLGGGLLVKLIV